MRFLHDDHGFDGPEIEGPWDRIPAITRVCYHRNDLIIEFREVVGFMGEHYVETRCLHKHRGDPGDWVTLGNGTTRTSYQLRRTLDLHAQAVCSHLRLE